MAKRKFFFYFFLFNVVIRIFSQIPSEVLNAQRNAPEDVIVGIGNAKADSDWESMVLAEDRARVEIAIAIDTFIGSAVRDYGLDTDISSLLFQEQVTVTMSNAYIRDSRKEQVKELIDSSRN